MLSHKESLVEENISASGLDVLDRLTFVSFLRDFINSRVLNAFSVGILALGVTTCTPYSPDVPEDVPVFAPNKTINLKDKIDPSFNLDAIPTKVQIGSLSANKDVITITGAVHPVWRIGIVKVRVHSSSGKLKFDEDYEVSSDNYFGTFALLVKDFGGESGDLVEICDKDENPIFSPYEIK